MFRQTKTIMYRFEMNSNNGRLTNIWCNIDPNDVEEIYNAKKRIWKKVSPIIVKYIALFYGIKPKYIAITKEELKNGDFDINFAISHITSQKTNYAINYIHLRLDETSVTISVTVPNLFVNKEPDDVTLADFGVDEAKCIKLSRKLIRALNPNKKIVTDTKFVQEYFRVYRLQYLIK